MTPLPPERWARIRGIFDAALEQEPARRKAFVDEICGDDPSLHDEVISLLEAHVENDDLVDRAVHDAAARAVRPLRVGTTIGPYRVLESIGEGGMGAVYLAERSDEAFDKRVAIKVVRGGLDSARMVERFMAERRILAALDHPNIATVLDGGTTEDGLPYLVMEYVDGAPIDRYCRELGTGIRDRIRLLRTVCDAVDHAHRRLVVHRDLKPGNVLVTEDGVPKLLDFGIAKLVEDDGGSPGLTATQARVMTPEYASPEQIRGEPVTTATDVHALGVLLYELLAGRHPFASRATTPRELEAAVLDHDPEPPSTAATRESVPTTDDGPSRRPPSPASLRRELSGDLDNIVLKALAKEPARRYPSAAELSADLGRFLEGRPVAARAATLSYRGGKFVRRNAVGVAVAGAFLATILTGVVVSTRAYLRADRMRLEAETQRDRLQEVNSFLARIFQAASPEKRQSPDEITARDLLDAGAAAVETDLGDRPEIAAAIQTEIAKRYYDLGLLEKAEELTRAAVAKYRATGAIDTPEGVTALVYLGQVLRERSDHDGALETLIEASNRAADLDDREVYVEARKLLANTYTSREDYGPAAELYEELLAELGREPFRSDPDFKDRRATTANDFGLLRVRQGEYDEAIRLIRLAIELRTSVLGDDHSETAEFWSNLAFAQNRAGRPEDAVESARHALEIHERVLGEDHLQSANSRINLADALLQVDRVDEAEALYPSVMEVYTRVYGADHHRIATVLNNAALALMNRGAPELAVPKLEEASGIYERTLGAEHSWTAISRHNLARAMRASGRLGDAETECRATLALRRRIFEGDHPDIARSEILLSGILRERDAPAAAEPFARDAARIGRSGLAPDHPVRIGAERELARCLASLDRIDEAERILLDVHAMCDSTRGPDDPMTQAVSDELEKLRTGSLAID